MGLDGHQPVTSTIVATVGPMLPAGMRLTPGVPVLAEADVILPDLVVASDMVRPRHAVDPIDVASVIQVSDERPGRARALVAVSRAGVRCTWQVGLRRQVGYRGPVPVIYVRLRRRAAWREQFYFRGVTSDVPLCVGMTGEGDLKLITVRIDPGDLIPSNG